MLATPDEIGRRLRERDRSAAPAALNLIEDRTPRGREATARLLALLQSAGEIRELTAQPQNVDHLIAAMYKELDL